MTHTTTTVILRFFAVLLLAALSPSARAEEGGEFDPPPVTNQPGPEAEPNRDIPPAAGYHAYPDGLVITPPGHPVPMGQYRRGPLYSFESDRYRPYRPAEPYYFDPLEWQYNNYRRLRESGPRPQYGIARPSDPVPLEPNRRYEWRDRAGGQNVRRPQEGRRR